MLHIQNIQVLCNHFENERGLLLKIIINYLNNLFIYFFSRTNTNIISYIIMSTRQNFDVYKLS